MLSEALSFVYEAFWALNTERPFGMGLGRIPFTAIDRYAQRYGITGMDEFDDFYALIAAMDAEFLRIKAPKATASGAGEE